MNSAHVSAHVSSGVLEMYVIGALDDDEVAAVEAHVASCPACEARLQQEARLDLAFTALADHIESRPRRVAHLAAPIAAAGGALAMAAAMMLWVLPHGERGEERPQSSEDPPVLTDTNTGDASTVTASLDLQADGSRVGVRD
jgi:hypothetical protein